MGYTQEEIEKISNSISVLDFFLYLESKGKVKFERKAGNDVYFRTENNKFSVSDSNFYDFKTGEGGKIIKAVMTLENKSWKQSLDFLSNFSSLEKKEDFAERKKEFNRKERSSYSEIKIQYSGLPNNEKLLNYFEERGISKEILQEYTRQIHYENNGKKYFGIGIENHSGGFEVRNPLAKIKIGKSDISEIKGSKNELIVFEGMTDMLSFLQLQKLNGNNNNRTLVSLNSITNVDSFLETYKDFKGKLFLCLDGDISGNLATQKIEQKFSQKKLKDVRALYSISENGNNDLNDYLQNKLKNSIFKQQKTSENERNRTESDRLPETQQMERGLSESNIRKPFEESKSEQIGDYIGGQKMGSNNVGNGFTSSERTNFRPEPGGRRSSDKSQQEDAEENAGRKNSLGRIISRRVVSNREYGKIKSTDNNTLDNLISELQGKKVTNEEIEEIVSKIAYISSDNKVELYDNVRITDEIKDICDQYTSGGVSKEGRGILDEYYTNDQIVGAIRNLIKNDFKAKKSITVLEPSVGTGNFLSLTKAFNIPAFVTAFEINPTTAIIAKILHPEADINLRSFETEFIDENGIKSNPQNYENQYDLVIGNPPYGEHRGFYKGLGEEANISKYEDYFVKRSLDVLKEGGTLAMVLPSGWLNRQNKLSGAEISNAFRLPVGAFSGTQIGTDIIILKKNSFIAKQNISQYFVENSEKILGEVKEKSNRFGRKEEYVSGDLNSALSKIEEIQNKKHTSEIQINLFDTFFEEKKEITPEQDKGALIEQDIDANLSLETITKNIDTVLQTLKNIKFQTPAVKSEIKKYEQHKENLDNLSSKQLIDLSKTSEKILDRYSVKGSSEYKIQTKPDIQKGILKYEFLKEDTIIATAEQNNSGISKEEINAFRDTDYNGIITNYNEHSKYASYIDGKWVHDFYYTEGNIYQKLEQLEKDFTDKNSQQYVKQKGILEKVLPLAKTLEQIIISPNHEFVHQFDLGTIEKERWNSSSRKTEMVIENYNLAEKFKDFIKDLSSEAFQGSSSWEVREFVDNQSVTGSDKERNALIRERRKEAANDLFRKFIKEELSDDLKQRFVKEFNKNYNNIHVPDYSKFPLFSKIHQNFKGQELKLTEVQKAGIGRMTTKGVGVLAHEVGFGKTLSGILSIHEAMERGNSRRPLIAVPNESILKQWVETIFETIPNAKINVLGNLGKDYDLSKFDNKDGEITLVTYEGFNNIGFSQEITERLASKFNYISDKELKSVTTTERELQKELQKDKEIEGKMKRGKIYDWEDFGFDHLTFDEVHNANHIVGKVRIEDRRFASDFRNQNQQTSKLGINTWMAAQYIQEQNNGRNVSLLSATPFTNKPLEYYSILSLVANNRLEDSGYFNVNNFFETFMEADNEMEIDAKGDIKFKTNVRRFKNNTLFQQLLSEFIDIKGEEDNPELVRPNKINKEYKVEQNKLTKVQYDHLNESFSEAEKGAILTHILNARLIAISPYLSPYYNGLEPSYKFFVEDSPKLNQTMKLINQNKIDIPSAGQIIYSELAVSEFPKLKEYLVNEIGYKNDEVGIISGATSKANRLKIQNDFNSGKIKVVIGSEAIQEGMNLQEKASDIYFLSLPYNFTSLRQVEGRIWRQGNENENVRMNFMLTNDSIDVFMLQKLQAKQARYMESMKKGADVLDISDINTQELKTAIITDPITRANIEIEILKKKIEREKNRFLADNSFVLRKFEDYLKVKSIVDEKENRFQTILGYSQTEDENTEYWKNKLPEFQSYIDIAKKDVDKVIQELSEKGVNVAEIEKQTQFTESKIEELNAKLENLPEIRNELIGQYKLEKEQALKKTENFDYVMERQNENTKLFSKNSNTKAEENLSYSGRKR